MQINAAEIKRPKTNLTVNPSYVLDKSQMKSAFMGVFTWAYSGDARKTLLKLALAPVMNTTAIPLGKRPAAKSAEQRAERKAENKNIRTWESARREDHLNYFTQLKKVNGTDPHFVLHLPVFKFSDVQDFDHLFFMFSGTGLTDEARSDIEAFVDEQGKKVFKAAQVLARAGLPAGTKDTFAPTLLGVEYEIGTSTKIAYLVFKITKEEAEALVSTDWMEIRPVDLYPLFSMWVEAEYVSRFYSKSVTSLSRIATTLPKHDPNDERVDQYGIGINLDGDPIWLPRECNATQKYESMFSSASQGKDGAFALLSTDSSTFPVLPANIPILVDWVNNKFTYSNSGGKPVIMPLEHMRKCNASMAMNILHRPIWAKFVPRLQFYAQVCNVSIDPKSYGADTNFRTFAEYFAEIENARGTENGWYARFVDFTDDDDDTEMKPLRRFVKALYQGAIANIEALNTTYAVSTVTEFLGMLSVIVKYGTGMGSTRVEAATIREKAAKQGVADDWTPPEMPLITGKFDTAEGGMLPHQAKVRNLLKDSPDFGVVAVDAGGGKSMLAITDVLYEIKSGAPGPYLIMCPSHLVANYVSEVVEFTDGQMNVIPLTSFNVRTTGFARYEAILKDAPINTVLVVDYDVLKFRSKSMGYGTSAIAVSPVIDMVRQFKPAYCFLDESHFLRNTKSSRFKTVMSLIADIPKKRIASGTLNPDSPSDLAGQMAMLDPTIFGSRDTFNATYGEDVRGSRVMKWRTKGPNSISTVLPKLRESVVWAQAKRKEWACALPKRKDFFVSVELTAEQRTLYDAIFDDMIQQIRKDAEDNVNARKLLDKLEGKATSKTDEDDFGDLGEQQEAEEEDILEEADDVGPALQPYLADIERYVTDPSSHPYAKNGIVLSNGERVPPLTGADLKAPKAIALEKVMRDHMAKSDSKILIFVNYYQSAESLFNAMPEDLRASGMLYSASSKTEMVNRFKTDKSVKWMIGIRRSLEVGLNLQQAGCLIRAEGVWTPGEQEQGDARIARPYFGPGGDKREGLSFYTLVADRTIDITKAARLRAKMVALAKFENTGNPLYETIEDIPIIPMNLATIRMKNDFSTDLAQYQTSMAALNSIMADENEEYKEKILAEGGFHFTQVKKSANPKGAAILARVPYAQGTELYKASELGLIRVDNYLGLELAGDDEDEDVEGDDEIGDDNDEIKKQRELLIGLRAHCEFGDGIIIGAAAIGGKGFISRVTVRLDDGTTARKLRATNVFVATRKETNSIDMRNKLAQAAGLTVTAPITVPGTVIKETKLTMKEMRERERQQRIADKKAKKVADKSRKAISVSLQLQMVNGYMRFAYIGEDERTVRALEALGFKLDQPHYYTRIRSYRHLLKQATAWAEGGFETTNQVDNDALSMLADELAKGGLQTHRHYDRLITKGGFNNYLRTIYKPTANKKMLNMFALITDGGAENTSVVRQAEKAGVDPSYAVAYLCLPAGAGHPGSKLAIGAKYHAPGSKWYVSNPTLSLFVGSLAGAKKVLAQIRDSGVQVTNVDELNQMAKSVRKVSTKNDEHTDVKDDE